MSLCLGGIQGSHGRWMAAFFQRTRSSTHWGTKPDQHPGGSSQNPLLAGQAQPVVSWPSRSWYTMHAFRLKWTQSFTFILVVFPHFCVHRYQVYRRTTFQLRMVWLSSTLCAGLCSLILRDKPTRGSKTRWGHLFCVLISPQLQKTPVGQKTKETVIQSSTKILTSHISFKIIFCYKYQYYRYIDIIIILVQCSLTDFFHKAC